METLGLIIAKNQMLEQQKVADHKVKFGRVKILKAIQVKPTQ